MYVTFLTLCKDANGRIVNAGIGQAEGDDAGAGFGSVPLLFKNNFKGTADSPVGTNKLT